MKIFSKSLDSIWYEIQTKQQTILVLTIDTRTVGDKFARLLKLTNLGGASLVYDGSLHFLLGT